ncbi:hypothetical protein LCGC14_1511800, partial [marine sediment metagenome]
MDDNILLGFDLSHMLSNKIKEGSITTDMKGHRTFSLDEEIRYQFDVDIKVVYNVIKEGRKLTQPFCLGEIR